MTIKTLQQLYNDGDVTERQVYEWVQSQTSYRVHAPNNPSELIGKSANPPSLLEDWIKSCHLYKAVSEGLKKQGKKK
jgi:hypothetical protein